MREKIKRFFFYEDKEELTIVERFVLFIKKPKEVIKVLLPIILFIVLLIPVPYYIVMGGGTMIVDDSIYIKDANESLGSIEASYVKEAHGNILTFLLSYIIPSFEKEKIQDNFENTTFVDKLDFENSLNDAMYVSFTKAGYDASEISKKVYVTYVDDESKSNLLIEDEIISIQDEKVLTATDVNAIVSKYAYKDEIYFEINRNGKSQIVTSRFLEVDGSKKLGISVTNKVIYDVGVPIDFKFSDKEQGPSGGLMIALSIYNKLTEEDITKGLKIAGTGAISKDGSVGKIGGLKYKIMGAIKAKADAFILPESNYKEALEIVKENNYDIKIINVETFDDAIDKVSKL